MSTLFINGSPNASGNTARLTARLLAGKAYDTMEGQLDGKKLFFVFQGGAPSREQLDTAEWTMSRFAGLYRMSYSGMVTNAAEAKRLAARV